MNDTPNKSYFSTGQMRNALIQIEDQMVHSNWMPSLIIGINRGGCNPGVYLSHRLKIPHEVIDIRLRDHKAKPNLSVLEKAYAFQKKILEVHCFRHYLCTSFFQDSYRLGDPFWDFHFPIKLRKIGRTS